MGLGKGNKVTGSRLRGTGRHHLKEVKASEQDVEGGQAHADRKWREGRRTRTGRERAAVKCLGFRVWTSV